MKDAFHHINLDKDSIQYTSFSTFMGQFEYTKLPFGLTNGPSFFMRFINSAFRELLLAKNSIMIYLDDILIATETVEENLIVLIEVLNVLISNRLELKFAKCTFLQTEINYLGYSINAKGIRPTTENISAIVEYPVPSNFKQLHSFLGLISYFRKFIHNFAGRAKPLYDLLKNKVEFQWSEKELLCFEELKQMLSSEPLLALYSHKAETELHCDASSFGFGSILMQKQPHGKFQPISELLTRSQDIIVSN